MAVESQFRSMSMSDITSYWNGTSKNDTQPKLPNKAIHSERSEIYKNKET